MRLFDHSDGLACMPALRGARSGHRSRSRSRCASKGKNNTRGCLASLTASAEVVDKAMRDKMYFATLEPEASIGTDKDNEFVQLSGAGSAQHA